MRPRERYKRGVSISFKHLPLLGLELFFLVLLPFLAGEVGLSRLGAVLQLVDVKVSGHDADVSIRGDVMLIKRRKDNQKRKIKNKREKNKTRRESETKREESKIKREERESCCGVPVSDRTRRSFQSCG